MYSIVHRSNRFFNCLPAVSLLIHIVDQDAAVILHKDPIPSRGVDLS